MEDQLILVDLRDRPVGEMGKMQTHERGLLHRAFSVLVFSAGSVLIQKRAAGKYHSAGLWTNTCCSHPRVGEKTEEAVHRRLLEEAGFDCELQEAGSFIYRAEFAGGLSEYEIDHVFVGEWDGDFSPDPTEAEEMCFVPVEELVRDVTQEPQKYTAWFYNVLRIALNDRRRDADGNEEKEDR